MISQFNQSTMCRNLGKLAGCLLRLATCVNHTIDYTTAYKHTPTHTYPRRVYVKYSAYIIHGEGGKREPAGGRGLTACFACFAYLLVRYSACARGERPSRQELPALTRTTEFPGAEGEE